MKSIMRSLLVIILFAISGKLISQDAAKELDRVYGLDQVLYNGKKYTYFLPSGTGGDQFLLSPEYIIGEVSIKGKTFTGIALNYDIYNQQLLLRYTDETGALNIIEVSRAWLENFRLENMNFKYLNIDDVPRFYQVLGEGPLFILYYWYKSMKLGVSSGSSHFTFTPPEKNIYVLIDDQLMKVRNNKGLTSVFDQEKKTEIKNYLRINKIRISKASDKTMTDLINYIGNL